VPDAQAIIQALMPASQRDHRTAPTPARLASAAAEAPAGGLSSEAPGAPASAALPPLAAQAASAPAEAATGAPARPPAGDVAGSMGLPPATPQATARPGVLLPIRFEPRSARVQRDSGPLLGELVAAMQSPALKAARFVIEGRAEVQTDPARQQRLAKERAEEVRLYLIALGVHPARLKAVAAGLGLGLGLGLADDGAGTAAATVRVTTVEPADGGAAPASRIN
jgi:outer membrane protein OmpA-like peptidoglycan-associated protein